MSNHLLLMFSTRLSVLTLTLQLNKSPQLKYAFKSAKSLFKTTVKEGIRSLKAERMHFLFG